MTDQSNKQNDGKPPVFQGCFAYFPRALKEVAKVSLFGKTKYKSEWTTKGWLQVPKDELLDAQARHILDRVIEGDINHTDGDVLHLAQNAWEALAALEVHLITETEHPFEDVMGDVMEARVVREKDTLTPVVPYQPDIGVRYVVSGFFDMTTKLDVATPGENEIRSMSWHDYFRDYIAPPLWPKGFQPKEKNK